MVQRSRYKASRSKRKEAPAPAATQELPAEEEAEQAAAAQAAAQAAAKETAKAAQAAEDSADSAAPLSVWTCPCKLVSGDGLEADFTASMERRRKLQRSRMNSLTYRCVYGPAHASASCSVSSVGQGLISRSCRRWVKRDKDDGLQPEYSPCDCASKVAALPVLAASLFCHSVEPPRSTRLHAALRLQIALYAAGAIRICAFRAVMLHDLSQPC
jgi:hypothetical protein